MAQGPRHFSESFVSSGVRTTLQYLSDAQKAQVLENIGLGNFSIGADVTVSFGGNLSIGAGGSLTIGASVTLAFISAPCADNTYANPTSITTVGGLITAIS